VTDEVAKRPRGRPRTKIRLPPAERLTPAEVRAARLLLGLTQGDLAAALGLGHHRWDTVQKWELGTRRPSAAHCHAVVQLLDGRRPDPVEGIGPIEWVQDKRR
jgi:DNA-binding transcriptional regulator YiaG